MTYLKLDSERLLGIVDGLNQIVATSLDVDDIAEAAARVARVVAVADGATVEIETPDVSRVVAAGDTEGAASTISVPLEHVVKLGTLTAFKSDTDAFLEPDVEALRLLATGLAAHISHAIQYASVAFESRVDPLTGLGNRLAFDERLGWELSRASRYEEPISLVVFDIDQFARFNDRFGPNEGDRILLEIAETLGQGRAADSCFRIGDDGFAVIMPSTTKDGAEIAAIRIGWAIANLRDDASLTVSAGVAQGEIPDPRVFFAEAEAALRESKTASVRAAVTA